MGKEIKIGKDMENKLDKTKLDECKIVQYDEIDWEDDSGLIAFMEWDKRTSNISL